MRQLKFVFNILLSIVAVIICWFVLPEELEVNRKIPALFATLSMLAMSISLYISIRPKLLDRLWGIDKAYKWHKWLGIFGVLAASLHWMLVPGPAGGDVIPVIAKSGEEMGEFAMIALLILASISMMRFLPYHIWYHTHKMMGPIFLISVYHTFFSDVPFHLYSIVGIVLILISSLGVISWIYGQFFSKRSLKKYKISRLNIKGDAIEVVLINDKGVLDYEPGQFAFVDFSINSTPEFHPYTITSSPEKIYLSFIIRALGDHTSQLAHKLKLGQTVKVDGPYGKLYKKRDMKKPQIWLAGGIGITPFLSWLKALNNNNNQEVHIFYTGKGILFDNISNKLRIIAKEKTNTYIYLYNTDKENQKIPEKIDANKITKIVEGRIEKYQVFACGPKPLLTEIKRQLIDLGLKDKNWHNENFNLR